MKKLINGILEFRRNSLPDYQEMFAKLALGQSPDTLFVTCSDSRVAVNTFASTDPGDLFVIRNIGNMIPICNEDGISTNDNSEAAAIEFALVSLNVSDIVICGHSECGAMDALLKGKDKAPTPNLREWLRNGQHSLDALEAKPGFAPELPVHNRLSQLNVLKQIEHLKLYPLVRQRLEAGKLSLHGWWFELRTALVYAYDEDLERFSLLDEPFAAKIIKQLTKCSHT